MVFQERMRGICEMAHLIDQVAMILEAASPRLTGLRIPEFTKVPRNHSEATASFYPSDVGSFKC